MGKSDLSVLPRMDTLLASPALADSGLPRSAQKAGANRVLDQLRQALRAGKRSKSGAGSLEDLQAFFRLARFLL